VEYRVGEGTLPGGKGGSPLDAIYIYFILFYFILFYFILLK
jgi:hypothetical protein